jgi:hypothetical protein
MELAMKTNRRSTGLSIAVLCGVLAPILVATLLFASASIAAQQSEDADKKLKSRPLTWSPPNVDSPVHSATSSPPCVLPNVLEQAGARTNELVTDLQNFTAQETISYRTSDREGLALDTDSGAFNYVVTLQQAQGHPIVEENRKPTRGSSLSPAMAQDTGLPEMVLIFLPEMQGDYEMKCEGAAEWEGQRAWVVHFQQRPDKPGRTYSFLVGGEIHPARLKGHAWIAADSGEVVHLEMGLMEGIPAFKLRQWYLAISYVPVKFVTHDVTIWLPQIADSFSDFGDHRTIFYHTFTNFNLFWTQTNLKIEKPKDH